MLDRFNRTINYLRISVTDRCNLRCTYCMPKEGISLIPHSEILSYEEIVEITKVLVDMGITKVRLTGGEPLVRKDIVVLVSKLAEIKGITDFSMTTNGSLLANYAKSLKDAGLHRVNISLDTLDPERYKEITHCGDVRQALEGIAAAKKAELFPIKINCVIKKSVDEQDAKQIAKFGQENSIEVRFIKQMNISEGKFWAVIGGNGAGDCKQCNRLRLTSNGMIKPCLFNDTAFSIQELGIREAINRAVQSKPESGKSSKSNTFYSIGG